MNNNKDAKTEITELPVTIKPRRLNYKLGLNAEVSVPLVCLITLETIRAAHTNNYKKLPPMFIFQDLEDFNVGKYGNEVWEIMVVLRLKSHI